jgi:DNA-binding NtrC family response regulator
VIDTRQLSGRMLVVDDDPDLLNVAARMVKSQGIEVVTANGSNEAMEILAKDRNFNFLFTDVVMPGSMNGIQLGDYAKSVINDIRVIITSGFPKEILELKGDINPEFVQLRKPYTRMQLNEAICKAVTPD